MARSDFLAFSPPSLGSAEIDEVVDTLRSDWITTGPKVRLFEERFADYISAPAALAVSSGTAAMEVALAAFGVGEGQEVITTPMTFCSTVHVIEHVGARPVLVDIDPTTLNIDAQLIAQQLEKSSNVTTILPVHMAGAPADMGRIRELARDHSCKVVEDAAHAVPAACAGRYIGAIDESLEGHAVCFSFYATKNLTTAEGGMITAAKDSIDEARIWSLHGMSRDAYKRYEEGSAWFYEVIRPGFKANMSDIQAALGIHQLKALEKNHRRRREIADRYSAAFSDSESLVLPVEPAGTTHAWHLYVLRLDQDTLNIERDAFIRELTARKIGTSVHFIPVHLHPYYRDKYGFRPDDFPHALAEYQRSISLPLHPRLSDEDVDDVIEAVLDIVSAHRR